MNRILQRIENYAFPQGADEESSRLKADIIKEIERLLIVEKHKDILARHMAEVISISLGHSCYKLDEVISDCLAEIGDIGDNIK